MNIQELENILINSHIRSDSYSLLGIPQNEALILEPSTGNGWRVYYCERGLRSREKVFLSENDACEYFLKITENDPTMKEMNPRANQMNPRANQ